MSNVLIVFLLSFNNEYFKPSNVDNNFTAKFSKNILL